MIVSRPQVPGSEKPESLQIALVNSHWNNRGDEAAHRVLWDELRRLYPGSTITVLIKDRQSVRHPAGLPEFTMVSAQFSASLFQCLIAILSKGRLCWTAGLRRTLGVLSAADLIVYPPGGAVISDSFFWRKQVEYLLPFMYSRIHSVPLIVVGPSFGPFSDTKPRRIRTWALNSARSFGVREPYSGQQLRKIGVTRPITVGVDLAILGPPDSDVGLAPPAYIEAILGSGRPTVGITITDLQWNVRYAGDLELVARIRCTFEALIKHVVSQGYCVLLIPQLFGNQEDVSYLASFLAEDHVYILNPEVSTAHQQTIISRLNAVVGMRYHSAVFAASTGTPFLAIEYEDKMRGFLRVTGLEHLGVELESLSPDVLVRRWDDLALNFDAVKLDLEGGLMPWRRKATALLSVLRALPD